jgi:hypothetical protein
MSTNLSRSAADRRGVRASACVAGLQQSRRLAR